LFLKIYFRIVNHSKNVTLTFDDASRQCGEVFRGKHKGKVFVTTHRMIFLSDDQRDNLLSFAVAFMYMKNLSVEQPIFGANYISGIAAAHPNG
jgi:DNA-binding transcriptional regulator of glucitol operon